MILHQFSGRRNRASQVDFNFNLLPQVPTGSTFSTTLDGVSNNGAVVSFTITAPGNVTTTYPASGNSASFLTSHASAGSYTYSGFATDAAGNKSATVTKTITVIVDGVIPYMRHTLNTASSIQNGSTNTFNIFYGAGPATGTRSYAIMNIPTGMSFSKTSGITDSENLTMTLDGTINGSKVITIRMTESGLTHDLSVSLSITAPVQISGDNEWHFTSTTIANFTPSQSGNYEFLGIGGGGAGGASSGSTDSMGHSSGGGGGSGYLVVSTLALDMNKTYRIEVGAGGTGRLVLPGLNGVATKVTDLSSSTVIFTATGGIGGGIPTSNGSGSPGGNGGSGGGEGAQSGEANPPGGDGGKGGNDGGQAASAFTAGTGQGTTLFNSLADKNISIADGGRSLPNTAQTHPTYASYPKLGIGEGGLGYGAGGGGGAGVCGSANPGYGGGGAGGIYPSTITAPKLASAGERAPGQHRSSVGGIGASGYLRIKLLP